MTVKINATEPCYLTLINNNKQAALNWTISGANVSADIMRLSFPFNTTKEQRINNFTMPTNNDIVFLYIGATQNKDSTALISWITPKATPTTPSTPVNPPSNPSNSATFLKHTVQLAMVVFLGYFML